MESYSELPLFKAPVYLRPTDRARIEEYAERLNYAVDSFDASTRSLPPAPRGVRPIRNSTEFLDTLITYLDETYQAALRTAPPSKKATGETNAEAAARESAEADYQANLLHNLHLLEEQNDTLSRALVYTKLQKRPGRAGGVEFYLAGTPGKTIHDEAWKHFEKRIADTKAALDRSPVAESRRQTLNRKQRRRLMFAALVLGGIAVIGLVVALSLSLSKPTAPQLPLPPLPQAYLPRHHRPAPRPPMPNPPPIWPQPAINPILLGYNPGIQQYLSVQTPFYPSPLYSYPA